MYRPNPILGESDVPPIVGVHDGEGWIDFLRRVDLPDGRGNHVDLVPTLCSGGKERAIEGGGLRNQTVQILARVVAGEKLKLFRQDQRNTVATTGGSPSAQ